MKTPETDHLENELGSAAKFSHPVIWRHARQLERERDEAREERDKMQTELEMWRDGNIMHQIHRDELEKKERERNEAREEVRLLKAILDLIKRDTLGLSQLSDCIEDDNQ